MFNAERLLGQLITSGIRGGGKGMSLGSKAGIGMGVLGVAVAAFEHFNDDRKQDGAADGPPPLANSGGSPGGPPAPPPLPASANAEAQSQADSLLMIRAMVAAAASDGLVDASERSKILEAAANSGLGVEETRQLESELDHPRTLDQIVADVSRDELRSQVYGASLLAIDVDMDSEQAYLDRLAVALQLDDAAVQNIRAQLGG